MIAIKVRGLPYTQIFKSVLSETPAHGSYLSFSPSAHHTALSDISVSFHTAPSIHNTCLNP